MTAAQKNPQSLLVDSVQKTKESADGYNLPDGTTTDSSLNELKQGGSTREDLPLIKPEDVSHFSALLNDDEDDLSKEELRDRTIMMLLLKVKNGTPPMRKSALKNITERAREFGAGPLFN